MDTYYMSYNLPEYVEKHGFNVTHLLTEKDLLDGKPSDYVLGYLVGVNDLLNYLKFLRDDQNIDGSDGNNTGPIKGVTF